MGWLIYGNKLANWYLMQYYLLLNHEQRPRAYNFILIDFSESLCHTTVEGRLGTYASTGIFIAL